MDGASLAGTFRFLDRLRGLAPGRLLREPPSLGVASGKGGTGKTFTSVNLAVHLARELGRVQVFDADLGLGNSHMLLGLRPERHVQHFLRGEVALDDLVLATPQGIDLLPGGSGLSRLSQLANEELRKLARGLATLPGNRGCMVVDSAAGISPQTMLFLRCCDLVLLVVHPELSSLTDAYALLKCLVLRRPAIRVLVLVNRVRDEAEGREAHGRIAEVADRFLRFPLHYLGSVPEDPVVRDALVAKVPLLIASPETPAARALREAGERLAAMLRGLEPSRHGFRRRLLEQA
ncbi:MAG: MinD/ParA family protein [Planctomycetota bacterium]